MGRRAALRFAAWGKGSNCWSDPVDYHVQALNDWAGAPFAVVCSDEGYVSAVTTEVARACETANAKAFPPPQIGNPAASTSKATAKERRDFSIAALQQRQSLFLPQALLVMNKHNRERSRRIGDSARGLEWKFRHARRSASARSAGRGLSQVGPERRHSPRGGGSGSACVNVQSVAQEM
jgi:hypothetical protein